MDQKYGFTLGRNRVSLRLLLLLVACCSAKLSLDDKLHEIPSSGGDTMIIAPLSLPRYVVHAFRSLGWIGRNRRQSTRDQTRFTHVFAARGPPQGPQYVITYSDP
uniref:Putative secreted protein n=1 Tax=Anopheles marajoara TaxID=58244 RepID=A0A2M4C8C4_9DIPT